MVQIKKCNCDNLYETEINSLELFQELKEYFEQTVKQGTFNDIVVKKPYHVYESPENTIKWYAKKWYQCPLCHCIWEFKYPDFPAKGAIRKLDEHGNLVKDSIFRLENRRRSK